jgi:hypothetical protein
VGSASCWVRWEICLFILVELMMAVVGCRFSVVSCRLWVLLRVGCGGKSVCLYSLSLCCRFSVVGCGLSQALFQSS